MRRTFDAVVIGAGPAGLTAARVIAESTYSVLLIDRMGPGGQLMNMGGMHETPGLPPGATGPDLLAGLTEAALAAGAELAIDEVAAVAGIGPWTIATGEGPVVATALIIATGLESGTTGVADEGAYAGRGLSHCAHCDGPLYAGQPVVVTGSGDWAVQAVIELAGTASEVTLVSTIARLTVMTPRQVKLASLANVTRVTGRISGLAGGDRLESVQVETADGPVKVPARAVFAMDGRRPATGLLGDRGGRDAAGALRVDAGSQIGVDGLFGCGDVCSGAIELIVAAVADGERAGHNTVRWLRSKASGTSPA